SNTFGPNFSHLITAGSISGAGTYFLGQNYLTVGGNNLSTTVSGVIAGGGISGGGGGFLIKVGTGTLTLSGINTYGGGTTVNAGTVTLSGVNTYSGGTFIDGGVLSFSSDSNLGAASGGLTFNGGTLRDTNLGLPLVLSPTRAITLNSAGGTFDVANGGPFDVLS